MLLCTLGLWAVVVPVLTGLEPVAVTSGSMHPSLEVGDVVLLDAGASPAPGTVATFHHPRTPDELVTHRLAGVEDGSWRTRGDANASADPWLVGNEDLIGIGRLAVPLVGLPVVWARAGRVDLLVLTALSVGLLAWSAGTLRPRTGGRHLRRTASMWVEGAGRLLLRSALLVALVSAAASQNPAGAVFIGDTSNAGSSIAAATVPSPAGVTATAGCRLLVLAPKIDLAWDPVAEATGYAVERDSGSGFSLVATVGGTGYSDTDVLGLTTYTYRVVAQQGAWSSAPSATATDTTGPCL